MSIDRMIKARFDRWRPVMGKVIYENDDFMTVDDIYKECSECRMLFFDNKESFAILQVNEYPNTKHLHILLAGGKMSALFDLETTVIKFATTIGASKMTFLGRHGFKRTLASKGWKTPTIYMEKEIPNG